MRRFSKPRVSRSANINFGASKAHRAGRAVGKVVVRGTKGVVHAARQVPKLTRATLQKSRRALTIGLMVGVGGLSSARGLTPQEKVTVQQADLLLHEIRGEAYQAIRKEIPSELIVKINQAHTKKEKVAIIENELPPENVRRLNEIIIREVTKNPHIPSGFGSFSALLGLMLVSMIIGSVTKRRKR